MANSKYEYVKSFERVDNILPDTWVVVRIDGRGFHKFSALHNFHKPNDIRAINLMNHAAMGVMRDLGGGSGGCILGYGCSDEFSFVLHRHCSLFERRESKLTSTVVSLFTAHYIHAWPTFFPDSPLQQAALPTFDSRCVVYPRDEHLRDYLAWRQADCHVNNLYNTTFHALVYGGRKERASASASASTWAESLERQGGPKDEKELIRKGMTPREAEQRLKGTVSSDKHELMFKLGINYNAEKEVYKKGSVIYWDLRPEQQEKNMEEQEESKWGGGEDIERTQKSLDRYGEGVEGKVEQQQSTPDKVVAVVKGVGHVATSIPGTKLKRKTKKEKNEEKKRVAKARLVVEHVDIIGNEFWDERGWIIGGMK